jgi:hypothetical protein
VNGAFEPAAHVEEAPALGSRHAFDRQSAERGKREHGSVGASAEAVRDFLDSRHGRHFAEDVASELAKAGHVYLEAAIEATIARWQGWRIGRQTFRDEGVPAGLPYLTGWVTHFGILGEAPA